MYAVTQEGGMCMSPTDICETPTPAGPVPTPYPNIGEPTMGDPACERVLICGSPALNKASSIVQTDGDQVGAAGGVVSGEIMGEARFTEGSLKVTLEGAPAVRLTCPTTHNANNCVGSCLVPSQVLVMIME